MKNGRRCLGTMGRRLPSAGRQCPSHTKSPNGLCALHRAASVAKASTVVVREALAWGAARDAGFVLDRLEAEERLVAAIAALREAWRGALPARRRRCG